MTPRLTILTSWPATRGAGSGTVTFLEGFTAALRQAGWDVDLEAPPVPTPEVDYAALLETRAAINADWSTRRFPAGQALLGLDWDGHLLTAAQRKGRQVIASPRGLFADLIDTEPALRAALKQQATWEAAALRAADWCFVASRYAKRRVMQLYNVPGEKIAVLPNGIHPDFLTALAQATPWYWARPGILTVAKFYPRKQIPLLIEAYARAVQSKAGIAADLHVIGDGLEWQEVQDLIQRYGLQERVHTPGMITDLAQLARYYRSALFVCHPSIQETFGNVLVEALAAGKAIVAADAASLPEVAGAVGMYVPPGDVDALREALQDATRMLLDYPPLVQEIAERALTQASHFQWSRTAQGFLACLQSWSEEQRLPPDWT